MTWNSLGRVIGPESLHPGFSNIAGAIGIPMDQFLRVFFTSRVRESGGARFSVPFFIDLDLQSFQPISESQRIELPGVRLGSYRVHGVFPFSVFSLPDGTLLSLPTGWRRMSGVDVETGIGEMFSLDNGVTWQERGIGPRFAARLLEPHLVCDASYLQFQGDHLLAYAFGVDWKESAAGIPERRYLIAVNRAESYGGLTNGDGRSAIPPLYDDEVQAYPFLSIRHGRIEMVFSYRDRFEFRSDPRASYKLGFASSSDGVSWERDDSQVAFAHQSGDELMRCYPSTFRYGGREFLLYSGNGFGEAGVFAAVRDA